MPEVPDELIRTASDRAAVEQGCYYDPTIPERAETLAWNYLHRRTDAGDIVPFEYVEWFRRDVLRPLLGWRMPDGTRRHWYVWVFVPRGNAKTSTLAGLLVSIPFIEDWPENAEIQVVSPAVKQSAKLWEFADTALRPEPDCLSPLVTEGYVELRDYYREMRFPHAGVRLKLLAAENRRSSRLDGFTGPGILEELHGLDKATADVLRESANKCPSPLLVSITTAGRSRRGPAWEAWQESLAILDGKRVDIRTLPVVYAVRDDGGWQDWEQVRAANPGLGVTLSETVLRHTYDTALTTPSKRSSFRQKNCNQWAQSDDRWLTWESWNACGADFDELAADLIERLPAYCGVDLSKRNDLASCVTIWPDVESGMLYVSPTFWLPNRSIDQKEIDDEADYRRWAAAGDVQLLDAETVELSFVREHIARIAAWTNFQAAGFDRKYANHLMDQLIERGLDCRVIVQGGRLAEAVNEIETRVETRTLVHDGNACLAYCIENACLHRTANGGAYPSKEAEGSPLRIDGASALAIAVKTWLLDGGGLEEDAETVAARERAEYETILQAMR